MKFQTTNINTTISVIKEYKNYNDLAKAYGIGIVLVYLNNTDIGKSYNLIYTINNILKPTIDNVILAIKNMNDNEQAEAIGITAGILSANIYFLKDFNEEENFNIIITNIKKIILNVFNSDTKKNILNSVEAYIEGTLIFLLCYKTIHYNINANINDIINKYATLDKAKKYAYGLYKFLITFNFDKNLILVSMLIVGGIGNKEETPSYL